jgi:PHD/YefM family antitoxin component YafN of YafNO toxin-antitoxin module
MPNIKNISSLRNYTDVLNEVTEGNPVFLVREGQGKYAILDMKEYDSIKATLWERLFEDLDESREAAEHKGWINDEELRKRYTPHA